MDLAVLQERLQEALGSEFTVGPPLGEGGFAAVFRARDEAQQRDVAVKVTDLGLTPSPEVAERFVREARTIARLEHPNIVPIYKVGGYKKEVLYIVMRCVDGPSLRRLIDEHERLSMPDATRIARQVADALAYAHRRGVVHRDIKPDNILLDSGGHVLVTDFGIAKAAEHAASNLTTEGMVVGTPHYMSPEQATADPVDGRSDIYSLGVVLYQMLTGVPPFDGDSNQSILMKQATAPHTPVHQLRADVPAALAVVVDCMLAKAPADRFQTAEEASRALLAALPAAAGDSVRVPWRRRVRAIALAGLAGLVVMGAAVAAYVLRREAPMVSAEGRAIPDALVQTLRRRRALAPGDVAQYVFVPRGREDSILLLVARRSVAVVTPRAVRAHPRNSVLRRLSLDLGAGLRGRLVLRPLTGVGGDTVFRALSFRAYRELSARLARYVPEVAPRRPPAARPAPPARRPTRGRRR